MLVTTQNKASHAATKHCQYLGTTFR